MPSEAKLSESPKNEEKSLPSEVVDVVMNLKPMAVEVKDPKAQAEEEGVWTEFLKLATQPEPENHNPTMMEATPQPPPSILSYFGLPPTQISDDTKVLLKELGIQLLSETEDADDFFMVLKAVERHLPRISDPKTRIERVLEQIKTMKAFGSVKKHLIESGEYQLDEVEETARKTGNWTKFLKITSRQERAVRS